MKKYALIGLIITAIIIYLFSNQPAKDSAELSNSAATALSNLFVIKWLLKIFPARKVAHFVIYSVFGLFAYLTFKGFKQKQYIIKALVVTALYALTDEFHQYFIIGRAAQLKDVLILILVVDLLEYL